MDRRVGNISAFLNTTEGRDKLLKITQYGARSFCYLQKGTDLITKLFETRLLAFASTCSLTRKFLKVGMQLHLARISNNVLRKDVIARYNEIFKRIYYRQNEMNGTTKSPGNGLNGHSDGKHKKLNGFGYNYKKHLKDNESQEIQHPLTHRLRRKLWAHFISLLYFFSSKKVWLKLLAVIRLMGLVGYFTCDHFCLAIKTKMLHNGNPKKYMKWLRRALTCHVLSCVCALLLNVYQFIRNWRRLLFIRRRISAHLDDLGKNKIKSYSLENDKEHEMEHKRLVYYQKMIRGKMSKIRFSSFKLILDMTTSTDVAYDCGFVKGRMAILSTISALMATRQLWNRTMSGKWNPCNVSIEPVKSPRYPKSLEPPRWGIFGNAKNLSQSSLPRLFARSTPSQKFN